MSLKAALLACTIGCLTIFPAAADDWAVLRLRGQVVQFVDGEWLPLKRGAVVPDSRVIRTLKNGNVTFKRGDETVNLASDTQIRIFDKAGEKPFTTVKQDFGTVTVNAEVKNVEHFAVQTPYLAAVVKGTRFVVASDDEGASVAVERGHVTVEDRADGAHVTVAARQSVSLDSAQGTLEVQGSGKLPPVLDRQGRVLPDDASPPRGPGANNAGRNDDNGEAKGKGKGKDGDKPDKPGKDNGPRADKPAKSDPPGKSEERGGPGKGNAGPAGNSGPGGGGNSGPGGGGKSGPGSAGPAGNSGPGGGGSSGPGGGPGSNSGQGGGKGKH